MFPTQSPNLKSRSSEVLEAPDSSEVAAEEQAEASRQALAAEAWLTVFFFRETRQKRGPFLNLLNYGSLRRDLIERI